MFHFMGQNQTVTTHLHNYSNFSPQVINKEKKPQIPAISYYSTAKT